MATSYHVGLILQALTVTLDQMDPLHIGLIVALIISVIMHEMAHGYAANWLGDPTARLAGRLSMNPLVHIDPLMSVILPGLLIATGSPIVFGAAKPVPYNPYNFVRHRRWGEAIVAAAGPATNIAIATVFAILIRFGDVFALSDDFLKLSFQIILLNIFLAFFNLVPIPPLDGSKILPRLLPRGLSLGYERFRSNLERNPGLGFLIVIVLFVWVLSDPIYQATLYLARLLIGI
ncbi:site-2 protease family protein [Candidatus Kaiserbacteria bacterium]|nr:site-2 protease family protein [Candidatus Kaiserbacteria bacterium]